MLKSLKHLQDFNQFYSKSNNEIFIRYHYMHSSLHECLFECTNNFHTFIANFIQFHFYSLSLFIFDVCPSDQKNWKRAKREMHEGRPSTVSGENGTYLYSKGLSFTFRLLFHFILFY